MHSIKLEQECNKVQNTIDKGNILTLDINIAAFLNYFNTFFENFTSMAKNIKMPINQVQIKKYFQLRDEIDDLESGYILGMLDYHKVRKPPLNHFSNA